MDNLRGAKIMRDFLAYLITPALVVTGFRFSKIHRVTETKLWKLLNTTKANQLAWKVTGK